MTPQQIKNFLSDLLARYIIKGEQLGNHSGISTSLLYSIEGNMETIRIVNAENAYYSSILITFPPRQNISPNVSLAMNVPALLVFSEKDVSSAKILYAIISYLVEGYFNNKRYASQFSSEMGSALREVRKELGLTQEELSENLDINRITLSRWEAGTQPVSPGPLLKWCQALELIAPLNEAMVRVVNFPAELLARLQANPEEIFKLNPDQFENLIADRLEAMGFEVSLTGNVNLRDGGIDLIAIPKIRTVGAVLIGGQVKFHKQSYKTGREVVERLTSWTGSPFHIGLLVTNTTFTKDARWLANQVKNRSFLRLRDFDDVKRWIAGEFWNEGEWREFPEEIELAPGISVKIPKTCLSSIPVILPQSPITKRSGA
jgi:transcriptional regulator with XRE-family HTH domain